MKKFHNLGARVHSVGFQDKIKSEVHLNICSRRKKQATFSGQKYWHDKG